MKIVGRELINMLPAIESKSTNTFLIKTANSRELITIYKYDLVIKTVNNYLI